MKWKKHFVLKTVAVTLALITVQVCFVLVLKSNIQDTRQMFSLTSEYEPNDINITGNCVAVSKYRFNCKNMYTIKIVKRGVGSGRSKVVDIGIVDGQKVVIKRLSRYKSAGLTTKYRDLLFLKEVILRDQLDHPGLIKLMGYCVRHLTYEENKNYIGKPGISAVYEYGEAFNVTLLELNSTQRLNHALGLAELITYMHNSPIGPLILGDFNDRDHFLMVNGTIKLIDFDYVHGIEYPCKLSPKGEERPCYGRYTCRKPESRFIDNKVCNDTNPCTYGSCSGINTRINTNAITKAFFKPLLDSKHFPTQLQADVALFLNNVTKYSVDPNVMVEELQKIIVKDGTRVKMGKL